MTIGLTVPIALAGKRITETATAFEYQMARVQAISGATSNAFKQLQGNAEELGASTIFTAREVGALQEEFAKLGFTAQEITKVTQSTLSLAQVTGATLPRAAEIAGSTLRTFNMDASRVAEVNDLVAVAISRSALDFESFAETMKYAGSQAAVSGITMSELGAAMGVLANRGVKGSIAGTRLRMIFAKLTEEGGDTHQKFLDLVHGSISMAEAIDRFGIRAATAIPVLQENADEFDRLDRQMQLAHGTLEIMQAEMDDTSFAAQKKLKSALEDVSIQIGKALLPIINAVAAALTAVANGFASLPTFFQTLIVVIGGLVAAIGPLLLVLGSLNISMVTISLISPKLATALTSMFGPIGILTALVATLALTFLRAKDSQFEVEKGSEIGARAMRQASEATAQATASVKTLIVQYQNENRTLEEKQKILDELQRLQPDYFSQLDVHKTKVEDLETAYDNMFKALLRQEQAKAFMTELNKLESDRIQALIQQDKLRQDILAAEKAVSESEARDLELSGTFTGTKMDFMYAGTEGTGVTEGLRQNLANLRGEEQEIQKFLDDLGVQFESINKIMGDQGFYDLLLGGSGKTTPESATKGVRDVKDIMADLAKELKVIEARSDALGLTVVEEDNEKLKAYTKALEDLIEASVDGADVSKNLDYVKSSVEDLDRAVGQAEGLLSVGDILQNLNQAMVKIQQTFGNMDGPEANLKSLRMQQDAVAKAIEKLKEETPGATDEIARLTEEYKRLTKAVQGAEEDLEAFNLRQSAIKIASDGMADGFLNLGAAMVAVGDATKSMARRMLESAAATISAMIKQLYVQWAQSALAEPKPALAKIALLGIGAGAISGFLNNIPQLAKGGIAIGPQLAVVGDNRSGREAIIPLEKLPGLMQKMGGGMGGRLYGSLDGYDIVLSNERNNRLMQRSSR